MRYNHTFYFLLSTFYFLSLFVTLYSLPIDFSINEIDFGKIEINQPRSQDIWLKNTYGYTQTLYVFCFSPDIVLSSSHFVIAAEDSALLNVSFTGKTNIDYAAAILFVNPSNLSPVYMPFSAQCYLPDDLYPTTYNLFDSELKSELLSFIANHTWIGYDNARNQMYNWIDNVDGFVECVYTGTMVPFEQIAGGAVMQCEHSWPQSMGADTSPARSDIHHLFPATTNANQIRSNLAYGIVTGTPNWENGGSKRGADQNGVTVFEPRDAHKGVVARALMYFAVRYDNPSSPFFNNMESTLKLWNRTFTPQEKELQRNISIESIQNKKNPFVEHPPFADRIYSISTSQDTPLTTDFIYQPNVEYIDRGAERIPLYNNGNIEVAISDIICNVQEFYVVDYTPILPPKTVGYIDIHIYHSLPETYIMTVHTSIGTRVIQLRQHIVNDTDETIDKITSLKLEVYPNPVKNAFNVRLNERPQTATDLYIYNIRGQKVLSQRVNDNITQVQMPQHLTSGIYFIRINNENTITASKFLFIK